MKPQTPHTPTPWKVWPEGGTVITRPISETTLARCIKSEDAAFIVRAVNAHEELLEIAREAHSLLYKLGKRDTTFALRLRQIIAKAEAQ